MDHVVSGEELVVSEKNKPVEKKLSNAVLELKEKLKSVSSPEEKVRAYLEFMKAAINDKTPRFKDYWDAKHECLPAFKETMNAAARAELWNAYIELSTEAKHLKTELDAQSSFAMEQIDLAITAVEADLEKLGELLAQTNEIDFPKESVILRENEQIYGESQRELNLLNALASRVTSLRKEVIKTEMRIRFKNKFFERLSNAGDKIFPRRKELIQKVSNLFLEDVTRFGQGTGEKRRDEIKMLQQFAKELTLDTQTFNKTRTELSRVWEQLKEEDKERKKEQAELRAVSQKNVQLVMDKIKPFAERCVQETFTPEEASKQAGEILNFMKTVDLGRDEVRYLKDELSKAREPINARLAKAQMEREKEIEESQRQRLEKIEQFKKRLQEIKDQITEKSVEELNSSKERLHEELRVLNTTHAEKELLEHEIKLVRDLINDKKEKAMLALSPEQRESLDHLYQVLEEWQNQKNEIRDQLEVYRKALAGSGFDFEKAMRYRELIDSEKARLDKINATMEELEAQIEKLEG